MVKRAINGPFSLRLPQAIATELQEHLFPGDGDEHGAVIGAAFVSTSRGSQLLGRRLFLAKDGVGLHARQLRLPNAYSRLRQRMRSGLLR